MSLNVKGWLSKNFLANILSTEKRLDVKERKRNELEADKK